MLTKDALLEAGKRRVQKSHVPGVGDVWMRSLSEAEWSRYQQDSVDLETGRVTQEGLQTAKPRLIALVAADENGNRLFKNADLPLIAEMDAKVVNRLYEACESFCGVTGGDAKNSETTDGDGSPTV